MRKDSLSYAQVRQPLQGFIYYLNVPSRWGTQTPFTNLTFDWVCPDDLSDQTPLIGGDESQFGTTWVADMTNGYVGIGYGEDGMTQQVSDEVKAEVEALCAKFPLYKDM